MLLLLIILLWYHHFFSKGLNMIWNFLSSILGGGYYQISAYYQTHHYVFTSAAVTNGDVCYIIVKHCVSESAQYLLTRHKILWLSSKEFFNKRRKQNTFEMDFLCFLLSGLLHKTTLSKGPYCAVKINTKYIPIKQIITIWQRFLLLVA